MYLCLLLYLTDFEIITCHRLDKIICRASGSIYNGGRYHQFLCIWSCGEWVAAAQSCFVFGADVDLTAVTDPNRWSTWLSLLFANGCTFYQRGNNTNWHSELGFFWHTEWVSNRRFESIARSDGDDNVGDFGERPYITSALECLSLSSPQTRQPEIQQQADAARN